MPKFEVHIPGNEKGGFNFTFRVDADTWMAALKTGMLKLGEQGAQSQNVLVDIQDDNSLHVTESTTGRVFQIRELTEQEAVTASVKATPRPASELQSRDTPVDLAFRPPDVGVPSPRESELPTPAIGSPVARPAPSSKRSSSKFNLQDVVELERPTRPISISIGRPKADRTSKEDIEALLVEVFERVQEADSKRTVEEAMYFLLDLAIEKIPSESGSVFQADAGTGDLLFVAARGPKAKEILNSKIVVPASTGIVGFCTTEGVSLALSDVQKDPRFYAEVGEKVNYETRSALCSPMMTHGRAFGCMQLVNRVGSPVFTEHEVGLLSYLAHQAALFLNARA